MKMLPVAIAAAIVVSAACGSSAKNNASVVNSAAQTTPASLAGAGTAVPTTRRGTPRPGSTPRSSPSPASAAGAIPTVPPDTAPIQATSSGLQYQDIVTGTGAQPQAGQTVTVNYTGWLDNGTKFDSSFDAGKPFSFTLGKSQVIKGWDEGLATMKAGGKRRLIIPAALGYGAQANGKIPPNSRLTFDVELLDVK